MLQHRRTLRTQVEKEARHKMPRAAWFRFCEMPAKGKLRETESKFMAVRGWGQGGHGG